MGDVDPDLLSHFEIQDVCADVKGSINGRIYYLIPSGNLEEGLRLITSNDDVTYMCELHAEWPTNEITFYVELEVQPLAIEELVVELDQPIVVERAWEMNDEDDGTDYEEVALVMGKQTRGNDNILSLTTSVVEQNDVSEELVEGLGDGSVGGAMDDNARGGHPIGCREVHVDGSVRQNVDDNATYEQNVGSEDVHVDEIDWLDEGYEGPDYLDDIFGEPCAPNNEVPNIREHQRETEKVNKGEHLKEQVTDKGKKPKATASDKAFDDADWAERVRCLEFNEMTSISNPQLCEYIKFPNGKVFRVALREYAMKKPVDIKFKLNEKTRVSVYCKYECGWKVYAS